MTKYGVDDMVMLSKVSENSILENIKKRYDADIIYTYIGHVLIAVNPYKLIEQLYTERTLKDYRGKYQYELPPHVYSIADAMFRALFSEGENQCVIISGESGAGKTVTSKHIMHFIAAVSGQNPEVQRTKDIILESNPLLEAFGNAKTIRNNNSSRFGKYMEIQFDLKGDPEGGRITNYLLEKSRVVFQANGERNFHIFYQLLTGADGQMKNELYLGSAQDYFYTNQGNSFKVDGIDDVQEFRDTTNAMDIIGFSQDEKRSCLRIVAAILHLGNIQFVDGGKDDSALRDTYAAECVAALLEVPLQSVQQALLFRTIQTGVGKRGSTYACPQAVDGAEYSRDALAKALYSKMFDWIVQKINEGLYINDPDSYTIGVLDIYGFEIFQKNGFEQMCINYVNEKLQQIFIQLTLKAEQEEYGKEGIPWENIDYFNNKICCDLIESKRNPIGVIGLLDDVCNFPKGSDDKFLGKLQEAFSQHAHFTMGGANEFVIKHYAGDVTYNVDGFVDKNKDLLFNDLIELGAMSQNSFIRNLFPEVGTLDKKRPTTAGFKIKNSIGELVDTLSKCQPHYIRCVKPNEKKARNCFDSALTLHQVRYLGLLENVRVRRAGFAYRQFYDKFFYRYRVCSEETWPNFSGDHKAGTAAILKILSLEGGGKEYATGNTKIFIRNPETVFSLEEMRERKVATYANRIQMFFGRFALRRYFWELECAGNDAIYGKKERRRLSFERPYTSDYINYRENYELKRIVEGFGKEKVHFADNATKYDRRSRRQRRILLMSSAAVYIIALEKNKDKDKVARRKKPFIYNLKRRLPASSISAIVVSSKQDSFMQFVIPSEHDNLLECRRKTEFLSCMVKICNTNVQVSDVMNITIKGGKKRKVTFVTDAKSGDGKMKGAKVGVAPGMSKDSKPNLPEPERVQTTTILPQRTLNAKVGGGGGGASAPQPPMGGRPTPGAPPSRPTPGGVPPGRPTPGGAPRPVSRGGPPRGGARGGRGRGMPMPMPGMRGRGRGGY